MTVPNKMDFKTCSGMRLFWAAIWVAFCLQGQADARRDRVEETKDFLPGAETKSYRDGENSMNLFVYKPEGWTSADQRTAFVYFFGGGWRSGTPAASWASWAASKGMVGIAPDYRTKNRFGTTPLESVADSRAALSWVVEHAEELGIDPSKIVVGGTSAGGHVALWTAITATPPGSDPSETPAGKPAALILISAVTDTSPSGYGAVRFGEHARALSPAHQLDADLPPTLLFHAKDDPLVKYEKSVALYEKLKNQGTVCELVTVPLGGHGFYAKVPGERERVYIKIEQFLQQQNLLPEHH
jgi:acetyl esterase/lipase